MNKKKYVIVVLFYIFISIPTYYVSSYDFGFDQSTIIYDGFLGDFDIQYYFDKDYKLVSEYSEEVEKQGRKGDFSQFEIVRSGAMTFVSIYFKGTFITDTDNLTIFITNEELFGDWQLEQDPNLIEFICKIEIQELAVSNVEGKQIASSNLNSLSRTFSFNTITFSVSKHTYLITMLDVNIDKVAYMMDFYPNDSVEIPEITPLMIGTFLIIGLIIGLISIIILRGRNKYRTI